MHAPPQETPKRPTTYTATITLTADGAAEAPPAEATAEAPTAGATADTITFEVEVTVFGFNLPRRPALKTAINLDESKLGLIYGSNSTRHIALALIETMWNETGCTNPFSKAKGEWYVVTQTVPSQPLMLYL